MSPKPPSHFNFARDEESTNLGTPNWAVTSAVPANDGTNWSITLRAGSSAAFRLRK
jgi:hypothetical protein